MVVGVVSAVALLALFKCIGLFAPILLGPCAPDWLVASDPVFCVIGKVEDRTFVIEGRTTLPDGLRVNVWVDANDSSAIGFQAFATVHDGEFSQKFDGARWAADTYLAGADFWMTPDQPTEVFTRYGFSGERLTGPAARFDYDLDPPFLPKALQWGFLLTLP